MSWKNQTIVGDGWNNHCQVNWNKIKMLDEVVTNTTLLIKEVFHICLTNLDTLMNREKASHAGWQS